MELGAKIRLNSVLYAMNNTEESCLPQLFEIFHEKIDFDQCIRPILFGEITYSLTENHDCILSYGANINYLDENGNSPLIVAAENGLKSLIRYLIRNGADASIKNHQGKTAFDVCDKSIQTYMRKMMKKYNRVQTH
ncbi:myosin-light-chain-phosphatase regulatory chain, putative [Trichomonas vaginalis G3]|uniref:Myosin-light-chain-phosphatase regulatory chain, putative n=1 Tax=Trichomonas vaginalis (strain ATCC PRA-98 / G3) TaxID=412133 RepID=A2D9C4_TRIV3|nr:response to abiotic stimulus [Trichomonas vaginalis G3]EAY23150.1 myosin-light-chain-phosphatase regulatory chain, putative [Trichomonas vaginalis G3]KAI5513783.1 response to abiotic stimulus [Trichomonas vaginalis G3]|eukprot:XP_001584136.1 myosin-light-chain-phosphatase regulatory chain [Trichomonas vaginalis G3]